MKLSEHATSELQQTINVICSGSQGNLNFTELSFVPLLEEAILGVHRVHPDLFLTVMSTFHPDLEYTAIKI